MLKLTENCVGANCWVAATVTHQTLCVFVSLQLWPRRVCPPKISSGPHRTAVCHNAVNLWNFLLMLKHILWKLPKTAPAQRLAWGCVYILVQQNKTVRGGFCRVRPNRGIITSQNLLKNHDGLLLLKHCFCLHKHWWFFCFKHSAHSWLAADWFKILGERAQNTILTLYFNTRIN